ncbi:vacuolar protein 14 C-terminal Fig4p binding-domain-containing protein [Blastocladiella britannica]|nr:vacuolar protein 14 C-terminal Fig4p binding-domain-containing protein [Blastocladiella britannica]
MPPIGGSTPAQAQAQLLLPPLVVRNLSDKVYDRRKLAALEVERIVRSIVDAHHITAAAAAAASAPLTASSAAGGVPLAPVAALISYLTAEFLSTPSTNLRNGGLIALAAVAIALGPEQLPTHLPLLIPPVLACFSDMDSRVRYYACESLYNIAKVARGRVLWAFPAIFDVLAKLVADTDMSVKSGAELLDRLLKDVITEQKTTWPAAVVAATPGGDNGGTVAARPAPLFSIPEFVRLLAARIRTLNPHTRSFLVAWLGVLDTVPGIDLVAHLPVYLPGLIVFLADESDDVRLATANLLAELLRDISEAVEAQRRNNAVLVPASGQGGGAAGALGPGGQWSPSFLTRLDFPLTFSLLLPFLDPTAAPPPTPPLLDPASPYYGTAAPPGAASTAAAAAATAAAPYPVPPAVARSLDVRTTCLQWTNEFILLAKRDMLVYAAAILRAILPMLADPDMGIASTAATTNSLLFTAVAEWGPAQPSPTPPGAPSTSPSTAPATLGAGTATLDIPRLLGAVLALTTHPSEATRLACLDWMLMVQKKAVAASTSQPTAPGGSPDPSSAPALLPAAFALLSDPSEDVVRRALQLVAQVSAAAEHRAQFDALMAEILTLFARDRRLLEQRGALIVRQLCLALPPEDVMRGFAGGLEREDDLEFASTMVTNLNLILITSAELSEMRKRLRAFDRDGQYLFVDLYRSWSHSAVATFSLCLLAQAYEHGFALLQLFEELEITVNLLVQIDKLVQLLESPVFTYLRLQLLEPDKHPYLFKCLYGLLMLLPQSSAFATLRNRLTCVSTLGYMHVVPRRYSLMFFFVRMAAVLTRAPDRPFKQCPRHSRKIQVPLAPPDVFQRNQMVRAPDPLQVGSNCTRARTQRFAHLISLYV